MPNLRINSDKYPADYGVFFYGSEVISVFNFVVGYLRVMRVVRHISNMRIELKGIYSLELDKPHLPVEPDCCAVLMQAYIGMADSEGYDRFNFTILTPLFLIKYPEVRWGRGYLLMPKFSWSEAERMVNRLVSSVSSESWEGAASQLCQYIEWEFDNYQGSNSNT